MNKPNYDYTTSPKFKGVRGLELTLQSALSLDGLLGHSSYVLLVISMLMRRMVWLRIFVIASALAGICYSLLILHDPVGSFWEMLLIVVNVGQLIRIWWQDRRTRFEGREAQMRELHFAHLSPSRLKLLIDSGAWVTLPSGSTLCKEGVPVPYLYYLHSGVASVSVADRIVARCTPGSFIGEMTISTGEPANASVALQTDAEIWRIEAPRLRQLAERSAETREALEAAFFRTLRLRIIDRNKRDAAAAALENAGSQ